MVKWKHIRNILVVWMLTGLWHGASWNFVFWGVYYGVLLLIEKYLLMEKLERLPRAVRHIYTMVLVMIGWVFFSNTNFGEALGYFGNLLGIGATHLIDSASIYYLKSNFILMALGGLTCAPGLYRWFQGIARRKPYVAVAVNVTLFLLCLAYLVYSSYNPFLYFRF